MDPWDSGIEHVFSAQVTGAPGGFSLLQLAPADHWANRRNWSSSAGVTSSVLSEARRPGLRFGVSRPTLSLCDRGCYGERCQREAGEEKALHDQSPTEVECSRAQELDTSCVVLDKLSRQSQGELRQQIPSSTTVRCLGSYIIMDTLCSTALRVAPPRPRPMRCSGAAVLPADS